MGDWMVRQALENWGEAESRNLEQRLLPDETSMNTADTAYFAALLMEQRELKTAGVITDTLHMPRVEYLFQRTFGPRQLEFWPLPAPGLLQDYWQRAAVSASGQVFVAGGRGVGESVGEGSLAEVRGCSEVQPEVLYR